MRGDNSTSTTPETQSLHYGYVGLVTLVLTSIEIKYQGLSTNPFTKESSVSKLLFLIVISCHAITLTAEKSLPSVIIFHVSGILACEILLWILVTRVWWCFIINMFVLLAMTLCFHYKYICDYLINPLDECFQSVMENRSEARENQAPTVQASEPEDVEKGSNVDQKPNVKASEPVNAQIADLEAQEHTPVPMPNSETMNTM